MRSPPWVNEHVSTLATIFSTDPGSFQHLMRKKILAGTGVKTRVDQIYLIYSRMEGSVLSSACVVNHRVRERKGMCWANEYPFLLRGAAEAAGYLGRALPHLFPPYSLFCQLTGINPTPGVAWKQPSLLKICSPLATSPATIPKPSVSWIPGKPIVSRNCLFTLSSPCPRDLCPALQSVHHRETSKPPYYKMHQSSWTLLIHSLSGSKGKPCTCPLFCPED